ncbi:MAG: sigma 54-interacting transcriptional regulator [Pseudolabrys sp.]
MRGEDRVVNRVPIFRDGEVVGAIGRVMFKNPAQVQALNGRVNALEKELEFYRREAHVLRREAFDLDGIVGQSDAIRRLKEDIVRIAPLDIPVLILGESGTGKELVAHAIHRLSARQGEKMIIVNSGRLAEQPRGERAVRLRARIVYRRRPQRPPRQVRTGPTVRRCSSTKSAICRSISRQSCCVSYKTASCSGSAAKPIET